MRIFRFPARVLLAAVLALTALAGASAEGKRTLSVLYFENTAAASDAAWLSKGLADMLVTDLDSAGLFTIVERVELEKVLKEQEFSLSDLADGGKLSSVGAILGAEILVYGSFVATARELRIDARAVEVSSGKVLATASSSGTSDAVQKLERELAANLAAGLGIQTPFDGRQSASVQALRAYYQGVDSMDAGRYSEAAGFFGESVRADPLFLKPGKGLEEAYRFLKDFKKQRWRREMNALSADIVDLSRRIKSPVFYSFGDAIQNPRKFGFADANAVSAFYNARPAVLNGDTPMQAIWNLQNLLSELADKAVEYFDDTALAERCRGEILDWARAGEKAWPNDPFLPEVLYQTAFVYREREEWGQLKALCERLMGDWPDYRMMWAVEEMYETCLEELK